MYVFQLREKPSLNEGILALLGGQWCWGGHRVWAEGLMCPGCKEHVPGTLGQGAAMNCGSGGDVPVQAVALDSWSRVDTKPQAVELEVT